MRMLANIVTATRLVAAIALLVFAPFGPFAPFAPLDPTDPAAAFSGPAAPAAPVAPSVPAIAFWTLYAWCGISDMIDGPIARATGSASAAGARLDSLADLVFAAACLAAVVRAVRLDVWLLVWMAAIVLCKVAACIRLRRMHGRTVAPHTVANKAAGLVLFVTVPVLVATGASVVAIPACLMAALAAIQEAFCPETRGME